MNDADVLFTPLTLPCGRVLKNRIAKAAMSDSLGDGTGHPTTTQCRLYERWAEGGVALSLIGEVQGRSDVAEKPGNLVLNDQSDIERFQRLARCGSQHGSGLWLQLGHAGALAYPPTSVPKGPSALDLPGLNCEALSLAEIRALPEEFARTARLGKGAGFGGVQIHAAHGFLLSQFLSPLFNQREDAYGGSIDNRQRLLIEVIRAVRVAVSPEFPIAVKLNATDQLEGGLSQVDALEVVEALDQEAVDLLDISGGTYFPGAPSASDGAASGPYFLDFARQARQKTTLPLMLTGGFKSLAQARDAVAEGSVDIIGLARGLALVPDLPRQWRQGHCAELAFPRFETAPEGGVTAWYTMRLTRLGEDRDTESSGSLEEALADYEARDRARTATWRRHFTQ
jgi:2,4-dienoyl-CoA reductase-like NADH-dependent reductase (Old Yellow Enzyme family)